MNFKRLVLYLFVMLVFFSVNINITSAADDVSCGNASLKVGSMIYQVNGVDKVMDTAPYINQGRAYVPVRFLGYAMGLSDADIKYDPATRQVTMKKGSNVVQLTIGSTTIMVNGRASTMDAAPEICNNRTMLPARFVAQGLGFQVGWDAAASIVSIYSRETAPQNTTSPTVNYTVSASSTSLNTSDNLVAYIPGEGHQVSLYAKNQDGSKVDVTEKAEWQSGNTDIATVYKGFIVGQSTGKTVITAQYDGQKAEITFDNTVHSLRTDVALVVYQIGEGHQVRAYAKYADGKEIDVTEPAEWVKEPVNWESSNNEIATVYNGFIVCKSAGKAVITVQYGGQKAEVNFDNTVHNLRTEVS
ncbi:MAG: copper amine oxidase N-terminal domain-containing protein, partial [Deltaproteobacteria bacterium]